MRESVNGNNGEKKFVKQKGFLLRQDEVEDEENQILRQNVNSEDEDEEVLPQRGSSKRRRQSISIDRYEDNESLRQKRIEISVFVGNVLDA